MAASMTLDMGNTDKLAIFKQDLDKMGIPLLPPDINMSEVEFAVEGTSIRYALAALKGVGAQAMERVMMERREKGVFRDLSDFVGRMDQGTMNRRQLEHLTCAGAFDSFGVDRAQVYESSEMLMRHAQNLAEERAVGQSSLFGGPAGQGTPMPALPKTQGWDQLEKLRHEFDAVGFYLSAHPLDAKAVQLERLNILNLAQVEERLAYTSTAMIDMAGVLLKKQIKVSQKSGNKFAFIQISDSSGVFEAVVFSEALARARDIMEVGNTLLLKATAERQEDQLRFTVQDIQSLDKALSGKAREVRITLETTEAARRLKDFLVAEGHGAARIVVEVPLNESEKAVLALPGSYSFSPQVHSLVGKTAGVVGIREL
jgi:DNA polymerase-3 subunit alpha